MIWLDTNPAIFFFCQFCHLPPKLAQIFPDATVSSFSRSFHSLPFAQIYADAAFHYFSKLGTTFCSFQFDFTVLNLTMPFLSLFLSVTLQFRLLSTVTRCLMPLKSISNFCVFTLCGFMAVLISLYFKSQCHLQWMRFPTQFLFKNYIDFILWQRGEKRKVKKTTSTEYILDNSEMSKTVWRASIASIH